MVNGVDAKERGGELVRLIAKKDYVVTLIYLGADVTENGQAIDDQCFSSTAYNLGSSDSRRNSCTYVISFHLLTSFSFSTNVE